jgi:mannose/cellobiose epimerase-like protein (N-acyl-D-glucosamine 2-epimerase family)
VTVAIGAAAALLKVEWDAEIETAYRDFWSFAVRHLIDRENGGWFPELDEANAPAEVQFAGKPDIYHSLQAALFPMSGKLSSIGTHIPGEWAKSGGACGRHDAET